jgi:hypothetical protein
MRLNSPPLIVVEPEQVAPHSLLQSESPEQANQQVIHAARKLLGFDPNTMYFDALQPEFEGHIILRNSWTVWLASIAASRLATTFAN